MCAKTSAVFRDPMEDGLKARIRLFINRYRYTIASAYRATRVIARFPGGYTCVIPASPMEAVEAL